jgi:hypothetical protein
MDPPPARSPRRLSTGARDMPDPEHLDAGQPAPVAGYYRAHDVHRSPIAQVVRMREGELLPPLPKGLTWVLMHEW